MASFYIPLTGLESDSTALNTIANDLANVNTTGFKSQTANFADLLYQEIGQTGSGDPIQVGAGVQVASIETDTAQGSINTTGNATDVALNGNGYFVLNGGGGTELYTRAGNFSIDSSGNLVSDSGQQVMGYPATDGVVDTSSPLTAINIPVGQVQAPSATSTFGMTANLNSSAAAGSTYPVSITVYDSLGESHTATVTFTKGTTDGSWTYDIELPSGVATSESGNTGTLTFDSDGNLTSPTSNVSGISFTGLSDGASDLSMTWDLFNSSGTSTISQVSTSPATTIGSNSATTQNGYASGEYQSFTVGDDGTVTASFSNGQKSAVGQIALANVVNQQGLQLEGSNEYATTLSSGTATVGTSGSGGLGTLTDAALEGSNVNISSAFADLIIAQRAFEGNSKAVTTFDTVTQETINMIH